MPFDQFFSSKNKLHYIPSDRYEQEVKPEVDRVLSFTPRERAEYVSNLRIRVRNHESSYDEKLVLRRLEFIYKRKHIAIQHRIHWKREKQLRKKGSIGICRGFNTGAR